MNPASKKFVLGSLAGILIMAGFAVLSVTLIMSDDSRHKNARTRSQKSFPVASVPANGQSLHNMDQAITALFSDMDSFSLGGIQKELEYFVKFRGQVVAAQVLVPIQSRSRELQFRSLAHSDRRLWGLVHQKINQQNPLPVIHPHPVAYRKLMVQAAKDLGPVDPLKPMRIHSGLTQAGMEGDLLISRGIRLGKKNVLFLAIVKPSAPQHVLASLVTQPIAAVSTPANNEAEFPWIYIAYFLAFGLFVLFALTFLASRQISQVRRSLFSDHEAKPKTTELPPSSPALQRDAQTTFSDLSHGSPLDANLSYFVAPAADPKSDRLGSFRRIAI